MLLVGFFFCFKFGFCLLGNFGFLFWFGIFGDGFKIVYIGEFFLKVLFFLGFILYMILFDGNWKVLLELVFLILEYIWFLVFGVIVLLKNCLGGLEGGCLLFLVLVWFWSFGKFVIIFIDL